MILKRILCGALIVFCVLSIAACSVGNTEKTEGNAATENENHTDEILASDSSIQVQVDTESEPENMQADSPSNNDKNGQTEKKTDEAVKPATVVEPAASTPAAQTPAENPDVIKIKLSIVCHEAVKNWDKLKDRAKDYAIVPQSGVVLTEIAIEAQKGDSVFSVLSRVCKEKNILLESTGSQALGNLYIRGINGLKEFDAGAQSGWLYSVNGEKPGYSCAKYTLKDGDTVRWEFTADKK